MLADDSLIAAKKSLDVLVELYRRQVWTDARTVNVMATAVTSKRPKLMVTALKFFLGVGNGIGGGEEADEDDDIDDDELPPNLDPKQVREALANHSHSKHTKRRARQTARMLAGMKKGAKRAAERAVTVFPAIQLLHDPQGLAEKVFSMLRSSKERFEVRLMQMNFVSRLIGQHRLLLLPFYSFVQRYLAAHQSHVTQVLAYLIQACHDLVPPDEILPVIRGICNNFITDRNTPEVIQVGLNAVREIIAHCPVVLEEEGMRDLVSDLVLYRKYKNKGVVSAARAVLNLIREIYPAILRRRDWGKDVATSDGAQSARPTSYGYQRVATGYVPCGCFS
ncbi:hypothetical protein EON62_02705 [archaeon]|nr:MAG: hypothetical protein EON62_02705 [archaeon]